MLDTCSRIVTAVTAHLAPRVAALTVHRTDGRPVGAGSGVGLTRDGFVLTNAHVVPPAPAGGPPSATAPGPTPIFVFDGGRVVERGTATGSGGHCVPVSPGAARADRRPAPPR